MCVCVAHFNVALSMIGVQMDEDRIMMIPLDKMIYSHDHCVYIHIYICICLYICLSLYLSIRRLHPMHLFASCAHLSSFISKLYILNLYLINRSILRFFSSNTHHSVILNRLHLLNFFPSEYSLLLLILFLFVC